MKRSEKREAFLADIIVTAIEGGIGYWSACSVYRWVDLPPREWHAVIVETEAPRQRDEPMRIDIEVIAAGLGKISAPGFRLNTKMRGRIMVADKDNDAGWLDADDADAIVQAGLFGDVVYG